MDLQTIQQIQSDVSRLLELMGISYVEPTVEIDGTETVKIELNRSGESDENLGILIGSHGETLRSIEYIVALFINKDRENWMRVEVDLDGYRKHREDELRSLAVKMAEKALFLNEPVELNPMPAADRRIVHMVLSDNDKVLTESSGSGRGRHVVIKPS